MARKGSLSPRTFFPARGDLLFDEDGGIAWECMRSNSHREGDTRVRYALLKGFAGAEILWKAVHENDGTWLEDIGSIERSKKTYSRNDRTGTWQER